MKEYRAFWVFHFYLLLFFLIIWERKLHEMSLRICCPAGLEIMPRFNSITFI